MKTGNRKMIDPIDSTSSSKNSYVFKKVGKAKARTIQFNNLTRVLGSNKLFNKDDIHLYNAFTRFGYYDIFTSEQVFREYLFFTKPDLNLLKNDGSGLAKKAYSVSGESTTSLSNIPYFKECFRRNRLAMAQLQMSCKLSENKLGRSPFMNILTNSVTSKLDLPGISAETQEVTPNIMGGTMQYRGHSLKSDNSFDFSLSFNDTSFLEIYTMAKVYDEYHRLIKVGEHTPKFNYIKNDIDSSQFSIYKFLVKDDSETIMYWAKITGVYFTDVPRSEYGDPSEFGNFSLNFHGQWVDDMNPITLAEFNNIVKQYSSYSKKKSAKLVTRDVSVNNDWVYMPYIEKSTDKRAKRRAPSGSSGSYYDYRLKWKAL